ncbi:carbonic anhydrase [Streptomyces sp. NPDC015125]|uniref:carbonic anhydrase n=1 Tax=Streptomyces sp. NPDC015125 TaxID=3364938 RepID=UPI0036F72DC5
MHQLTAHARSFEDRCVERGEEFRRLGAGQSPQALFLTCSDSRVVPSLITGAAPGDLFELRTAGNIVPEYRPERPAGEAATIEYAVRVLGVEHIVVCGHSHCGAVGALVRGEDLTGVPAVRGWLESAAPALSGGAEAAGADGGTPELAAAVQRHALTQAERLRAHPCVAEGLAAGRLSLDVWFYEVHTGAVRRHRPETGRFEPL